MIKMVIQSLATLVMVSNIFIGIVILTYILEKIKITKLHTTIKKIFAPYAVSLAFLVALTATLGSLFLSDVAKYQPCLLCWYQRIIMYPQAILLYIAILRRELYIRPYLMVLSYIGIFISAYHYFIQRFPQAEILPCDSTGVSCTRVGTLYFGYISIPFMALTGFILILIFLSFSKTSEKTKNTK